MRQTTVLFRKSHKRAPQLENEVPFREMYPLKLQNKVNGFAKKVQGKFYTWYEIAKINTIESKMFLFSFQKIPVCMKCH